MNPVRLPSCIQCRAVVALSLGLAGCYDLEALRASETHPAVYVRSNYSELCVHASASEAGAQITQDACSPGTMAIFEQLLLDATSYQLRLRGSTLCLSAVDDTDNGVITLVVCSDADYEVFSHDVSSGHVTNHGSSKCLSVYDGSKLVGGVIEQYSCGTFVAQSFELLGAPTPPSMIPGSTRSLEPDPR